MDNKNPVFRSIDIIEERILEKLTVEHIANSIHFSKYHYQRLFREMVGDSVMGYVTKCRLTLAGEALLTTNASILDIALQFGYDSHEGFTRSFKAYMGITPTEYRKHNLSTIALKSVKGKCAMLYSKTTDGIIRELNEWIIQVKETAAYARKHKDANAESAKDYSEFWTFMADKSDAMAEELRAYLERITAISQRPDEISAGFMIIKAIEDIAFKSNIAALNAGLMISRAAPEHRAAYKPIIDKYYALAGFAHMKVGKIAEFFNELAVLIFDDMRKGATQRIQSAVEKGKSAAADLTSHADYPYGYIADELMSITNELASMPLADITVSRLEDYLFRLHIISFAADTDAFRVPAHKGLFSGIAVFQESIREAMEFFQSLSVGIEAGMAQAAEPNPNAVTARDMLKDYSDLAYQGNILLFVIRGEVQKIGAAHPKEGQKAAFDGICEKLNKVIQLAHRAVDETSFGEMAVLIREVHREMIAAADKLGLHGSAIRFIAEEVRNYAARAGNLAQ